MFKGDEIKSERNGATRQAYKQQGQSLFIFLSPSFTSSPVQPSTIHPSTPLIIHSVTLSLPRLSHSGHLTLHPLTHPHMHLSSSNEDSSSSTSPTVGRKLGRQQETDILGLDIYSMLSGLVSVAQQGGGTGKGHTGHLPVTVTSGREQVLMSSVPVVTDQLEHVEKSCALHFSTDVFS